MTPFPSATASRPGLILFLCCSLLLIDGCSALSDLARNIQEPQLSVTDVEVVDFNFTDMEMAFDVTVDNPNALAVQMLSYDYNLDIREHTLVSGQQDRETSIEASGESTIRIPVRLNYEDVYNTVQGLSAGEETPYAFSSTFAFDLPGLGRTEIPVNRKGEIPVLRLPSVSIGSLQVDQLNLSGADLTLRLDFDNPNRIGFDIGEFDYSLDIDGSRWAEGTALEGVSLGGNEVSQLEIPIRLNFAEMGMSAYRILTGSEEVEYDLNGSFSLGADHPLLGQTEFEMNREGRVSVGGN